MLKLHTEEMKYEFILKVYNSTTIVAQTYEVEADSEESAFERASLLAVLAEKVAYDVSGDLYDPYNLEVEWEFNREIEDEE